ncbi:MAG TPA: DUF3240 family protein [Hyphomicrobiales bacterium]|nr:DUF3240 family protein [Hyphomicrobiales bacterium]
MHTMLVLNVAPELEEELVDCLLELPEVEGFSSYHVYGHGSGGLNTLAEQVRGRRKRMQVEMIVACEAVPRILAQVKTQVGGDGVYWEQLVHNRGRLGTPGD